MGMAASQARLLSITARIHDVEYQAQSIQNAKIQLATQSDQVYQEYLEALDATTLTIKNMDGERIVANFNNLYGRNAVESINQYAFRDSKDRLIVPEDIKESYDYFMSNYNENDPYAFAMYMLGGEETIGNLQEKFEQNLREAEDAVAEEMSGDSKATNLNKTKESMQQVLAEAQTLLGDDNSEFSYADLYNAHSKCEDDQQKAQLKELIEKYDALQAKYQYQLYNSFAEQIYAKATEGEDDFNQEDFDYYVKAFKQIQAAGGECVSISDYDGINGDAANDSEWLQNMIQCGKITIDTWSHNNKTGEITFASTSVASDSALEYTTTSTIDKKALAKAEAEYEKKTKDIDQKDKRYDLDLSKLETERNALTTEYDSVKKVISDNIERTFGIFS